MSRTEKKPSTPAPPRWEGDLFRGNPDWQKLHNYPQPRLTAEEQAFLDGPVEEACRMANDFAITHEMADLPPELWAYLKEHRFFAMIIKKEYGGLEFSAYAQARVLQKLSGVSGIPGDHRRRPELAGSGRTAAALRYRRTEESLSAASGTRPRKSLASLSPARKRALMPAPSRIPAWCAWATGRVNRCWGCA